MAMIQPPLALSLRPDTKPQRVPLDLKYPPTGNPWQRMLRARSRISRSRTKRSFRNSSQTRQPSTPIGEPRKTKFVKSSPTVAWNLAATQKVKPSPPPKRSTPTAWRCTVQTAGVSSLLRRRGRSTTQGTPGRSTLTLPRTRVTCTSSTRKGTSTHSMKRKPSFPRQNLTRMLSSRSDLRSRSSPLRANHLSRSRRASRRSSSRQWKN